MPAIFPKWFPSGFRLIDGGKLSNWFNNPQESVEDNITAAAGGGQPNAYQLSAAISRITTVATTGDSVKLPPTKNNVGGTFIVINDAANGANVFSEATATIDGGGAGVALSAGRRTMFLCVSIGAWQSAGFGKST